MQEPAMPLDPRIDRVTERIRARSRAGREAYLARISAAAQAGPRRSRLSCANQAHGFAACAPADKAKLVGEVAPNLAIVTAYNDMLSAHQPYERFPEIIRAAARAAGGTAQVAGGVPAMCDGVTQGRAGMELSLFSRDVIALSTAVALSHDMFDAAVYLGICDKIVPGLLIGALTFGHLPAVFVPAGPMTSGLSNAEKAKTRQLYAEGKVGKAELLASEMKSYHGPGTCTFYGTANSNQMFVEIMGLHLPGASFINPGDPLRDALTREATRRALSVTALGNEYRPIGEIIDERAVVNAVVGLNATGGSTNHTMHLVAIAAAAGITLTWDDFNDLSEATPLLTRIYPNGQLDVNHFQQAGGMGFLIRELMQAGLLHADARTVMGEGLAAYTEAPRLEGEAVVWSPVAAETGNPNVLRGVAAAFQPSGGLRLLSGNLGRAMVKVSAVAPERQVIEAPAVIFTDQEAMKEAFHAGRLHRDCVVVVRFQGPQANGMPELHELTPFLSSVQDAGHRVALLTDGRMSGASGKVLAAIHLTPEALDGGPIARLRDGDVVRIDAVAGTLDALVPAAEWQARPPASADLSAAQHGVGRELFANFRRVARGAEAGGGVLH
jgi:phosphogluconate dehydratase